VEEENSDVEVTRKFIGILISCELWTNFFQKVKGLGAVAFIMVALLYG
jgi:hypothetical protein